MGTGSDRDALHERERAASPPEAEPRQVKQVLVIRRDLKMRRGKEIAQGAHASMAWLTRRLVATDREMFYVCALSEPERAWVTGLFTKVTCQADSGEALRALHAVALNAGLEAHLITDAGKTEFGGVPTLTALAIGPDWADKVDAVTGGLQLY